MIANHCQFFSHLFCTLCTQLNLWPSFSLSTGCVVPMRGDWAIFYHVGSIWVGRLWSARELNPGHGEDRQWDSFILPLSYHDPGHGEDRQWDSFILPLSYYDPGHGEDKQWDSFIIPLSSYDIFALRWSCRVRYSSPQSHYCRQKLILSKTASSPRQPSPLQSMSLFPGI